MMGPLIVISGPSGCGKSTLIERLLDERAWALHLSVSVTTRKARPGEVDGVHYYFWQRDRFLQEVEAGGFLEWADVFGNHYGTLRREVEPYRQQGMGVLLEIDVEGRRQVKEKCPEVVSIFVTTPSLAVLEDRLRRRGSETEDSIARRLRGAATEIAKAQDYDYQIINDDLEAAIAEARAIVAPLLERQSDNG
jgi:guanylate kinase